MYEPRIDAYVNEAAYEWRCEAGVDFDVLELHSNLPQPYVPTPLIQLPPTLEAQCQVGTVLFKDESDRFDTPSFKPLGATWACHRAICAGLGLPATATCDDVSAKLVKKPFRVTLHAATDGRWGQAVACMADWLGVKARIYVPDTTPVDLREEFLQSAELVVVHGDYDAVCKAARSAVRSLNREAEENADTDIVPMLVAVGWKYGEMEHHNDGAPDLTAVNVLNLADNTKAEEHDNHETPQVSVTEVEEEEEKESEITVVDEAGNLEESITVVTSQVRDTEEINTNVPVPAERAEGRVTLANIQAEEPHMEEPLSIRPMTPLSDFKRVHLLVQDGSFPGYEKIPSLVVEGYSTMMREIDEDVHKLFQKGPDMIIVPVGAGSLAQAVVSYYKCIQRKTCPVIVTVEPKRAACLQTSLRNGQPTTIVTGETSMCAMNRSTVSSLAWPILRKGVDIAITVTDDEVDAASDMLLQISEQDDLMGENGPCSASTLAALCKLRPAKHPYGTEGEKEPKWLTKPFELGQDSVVVLIGTESLFLPY